MPDPPSFEVQALEEARATWLNAHANDGLGFSLLHNEDGFTAMDTLISTRGVPVNLGMMSRGGIGLLGFTQLATVNESLPAKLAVGI